MAGDWVSARSCACKSATLTQGVGGRAWSKAKGAKIATPYWISPCQRCYYCTVVKDTSLCPSLFTVLFRPAQDAPSNPYTDYAWLPPRMAFYRIPETTPSEAVIAFGCAMLTMLQGLERLGGLNFGQTVVIQGCGPVGLAATLLSHLAGAGQVIVVGAPQHRLAMARRLGATALINLDEDKTAE